MPEYLLTTLYGYFIELSLETLRAYKWAPGRPYSSRPVYHGVLYEAGHRPRRQRQVLSHGTPANLAHPN